MYNSRCLYWRLEVDWLPNYQLIMNNAMNIHILQTSRVAIWLAAAGVVLASVLGSLFVLPALVKGEASVTESPRPQPAAVHMFLKFGDIKGESIDNDHKGEIDVLSWSWGMSQSGVGTSPGRTGGGAGKVNIQDLSFTKKFNKSSPLIMKALATGEHIKEAKLVFRKAGEKPMEYMVITMTDVLVTSYSVNGDSSGITENITLNFASVKVEYKEQKADGSEGDKTQFGYDIQKGQTF